MNSDSEQKIFYAAALNGSETYTFWTHSIKINPDLEIDDLAQRLVAEYAKSHHAFSVDIYKPHRSTILNSVTAKDQFPNHETLLRNADCISPAVLIKDAIPERRSLVVVLNCTPPGVPVLPAAEGDDPEANDVVGQLQQDFKKYVQGVMRGPTPSTAAKSADYRHIQGSDVPLLDGRLHDEVGRQTVAPPIEIYHPVFGKFCKNSKDPNLQLPESILRLTASLLRSTSSISVREAPRESASREILADILGVSLNHVSNQDKSSADYMSTQDTPLNVSAAPVIVEVKGELGLGGSDPSVQSSFSYARFYCSPERAAIRDISCCPAFLVGLAGPWLVILGAVFTSRVIVQRLSAYEWLGCSRVSDDRQVFEVARRLYALRLALEDLKANFYKTLTAPIVEAHRIHPRFCPSISSFTVDGKDVPFVYVQPLERDPSSVTFKVIRIDNKSPLVIKFVRRYGVAAHKFLEGKGLAPKLLSYMPLGDLYDNLHLVVMEYIEGQTLHDVYGATGPLPLDVREGVQNVLDVLSKEKFVFGDLRRPNVMLVHGTQPVHERIRFIDFDWAGEEGPDLRYPFHLASVVRGPSGASDYDLITHVHQDNMFKNL